ncbi:hypothetical protein DL93DRAFT_2094919 [Clavulina sp. PMI_390]|nr:hypothetical protein DL93DRAFT_2094919 [Clavulina sp. PMI_390]
MYEYLIHPSSKGAMASPSSQSDREGSEWADLNIEDDCRGALAEGLKSELLRPSPVADGPREHIGMRNQSLHKERAATFNGKCQGPCFTASATKIAKGIPLAALVEALELLKNENDRVLARMCPSLLLFGWLFREPPSYISIYVGGVAFPGTRRQGSWDKPSLEGARRVVVANVSLEL